MLTSTSPLLLLRPIVMRRCLTMYSNSRASSRAIGAPLDSGFHCIFDGLAGADFSASRAHASLSWVREYVDIAPRAKEPWCSREQAREREEDSGGRAEREKERKERGEGRGGGEGETETARDERAKRIDGRWIGKE